MTQPTCSYCGAHAPCMVPSCPLGHLWPSPPTTEEAREAAQREADWLREEVSNTDWPATMRVRFAHIANAIYALLATPSEREILEKAARVAEGYFYLSDGFEQWHAGERIAKAIRALSPPSQGGDR